MAEADKIRADVLDSSAAGWTTISTTFTKLAATDARLILDDLRMAGVRAAVVSTKSMAEAAQLLGPDSGYMGLKGYNDGETAVGYAKRIGHVDALVELAKLDRSVTAQDLLEAARRSPGYVSMNKAEDLIAARALEGQTEGERIRRSGSVDMLITLAEHSANITPVDVLVGGVRSSDAAEQKKARDYFRKKVTFKAASASPQNKNTPRAAR